MSLYKKETIQDNNQGQAPLLAAYWALGTVLILAICKTIAYVLSGSAAMLGSLTDTLSDGAVSTITYLSVRYSLKPADEDHRHGHGKIEGFSALLQASFLCGAAVFLFFESLNRFGRPEEISYHGLAIAVSILAIVLSIILVRVQQRAIDQAGSLAIEADQKNYSNDIIMNIAVIIGLGVHYFTGLIWVDAALGLLISGYIAWTGFDIGRKAADMLMDKEISEEERAKILTIITANTDVRGVHDLRTRRTGMDIHISFDVELDGDQSLYDAHATTRELEFALLAEFPNAEIIIHMDPEGDTYDTRHKVQGVHH